MAAAHESTQHALSATAALDPAAIEQLHAAARRYARAYTTMPPMSLFTQLVELRRTVWDLLDQTRRPRQQTELYLIAGLITGLMASVSWDLGHPDVAEEQAQAAITYGSVIEHLPLMSWARALQATVTFWGGRPRQAEKVAAAALELAPPGTARVRLHAVHARALAMLGARGEVAEAVERATDELGSTDRDEFFSAGGELAFGSARLSLCAASSYIALGEPAAAEREAQAALDEWARTPEGDRWLPGELSARADLVAARVLDDSLDGVVEALKPVLKLSPDRRTEALTRRLAELRRAVSAPRFRGSPSATEIGEQIEAWTARTVARPSLPPVG
ncbi:hypothetical protein LX15_004059 [Streptoalloteichus tenebrarius]|uniref:Transcriptional regulator n=2 Tax=Streptoalloteichus tenebrarius (strain ATCC 17920 / DSM 40477 / JCM 4838 / CBS 697.72 / NBRC 16177 / NCIMB 11028 / NRRL B-12390 / A12253. 1 / ISP 5477) TaxID=1933 RepID=A0ABT1HXV5_STRSD|nr:hypothetical protein [Streptoalloteichus tenebrarius]